MKKIYLGIDTSNYTTSIAVIDGSGKLIANIKKLLPVKAGERGLRQSDAVFHHVKNAPELIRLARTHFSDSEIGAIGVSYRPRNHVGSYMPCFLVGDTLAEGMSAAAKCPAYKFSHQCGHVMAALFSSGRFDLLDKEFAALHVSGGTTELLRVRYENCGFSAELVGGSADLNAGQVIDRIGVALGLGFPAGRELEALALKNDKPIPKRKALSRDMKINLSGLENLAIELYSKTEDKALVAAFVFEYIGNAISAMCEEYTETYGDAEFVFAGGVMSNTIIRRKLEERFKACFAEPEFSTDNAVGIAELARRADMKEV